MGAFAAEIVDDSDNVAGALLLAVESRIGRLVAQTMAERIDAGDAKMLRKPIDNAGLLPALRAHQQAVLQHQQWPRAIDRVVKPLSAMNRKWHTTLLQLRNPGASWPVRATYSV
jgi:hypothetical protein